MKHDAKINKEKKFKKEKNNNWEFVASIMSQNFIFVYIFFFNSIKQFIQALFKK